MTKAKKSAEREIDVLERFSSKLIKHHSGALIMTSTSAEAAANFFPVYVVNKRKGGKKGGDHGKRRKAIYEVVVTLVAANPECSARAIWELIPEDYYDPIDSTDGDWIVYRSGDKVWQRNIRPDYRVCQEFCVCEPYYA